MKALLLASIISTSTFAACPDLTGTYPVCKDADGEITMTKNVNISQKIVSRVTEFTIDEDHDVVGPTTDNYIADGMMRTEIDSENQMETQVTVSCKDDKLVIHMDLISEETSEKFFFDVVYSKKDNQLLSEVTSDMLGSPETTLEICE